MKVLVSGAGGFLGRRVVTNLLLRGHRVVAMYRPRPARQPQADSGADVVEADLCTSSLEGLLSGVDAVVHLAARMEGTDDEVVGTAREGTRRLLEEMERAGTRRLILASSLSVYDWSADVTTMDEDSPIEARPERRDGYTAAKLLQERLAKEHCGRTGTVLSVLRPAMIWGPGRSYPVTVGLSLGPLHLVFGAGGPLPAVYVDNCADAFGAVLDAGPAASGAFNVVDFPAVTAGEFASTSFRQGKRRGVLVRIPYGLALRIVGLIHRLAPPSLRRHLPGFLAPARFAARYRRLNVDGGRLRRSIGWAPPHDLQACFRRTHEVNPGAYPSS